MAADAVVMLLDLCIEVEDQGFNDGFPILFFCARMVEMVSGNDVEFVPVLGKHCVGAKLVVMPRRENESCFGSFEQLV